MNETERSSPVQPPLVGSSIDKELFTIFFLSFKYSQGDVDCHNAIFRWLALAGYFQGLPIPDEVPQYLMSIKPPRIHSRDYNARGSYIERSIVEQWDELRKSARCSSEGLNQDSEGELVSKILGGMIARDLGFQKMRRGGREVCLDPTPDSRNDPHASYVRKYCLLGEDAGHEAYNNFFSKAAVRIVSLRSEDSFLKILVNFWERNHPGHSFWPEDFKV